jgi:two-component system alkaline phosphatase synthesis response regulator PhoP
MDENKKRTILVLEDERQLARTIREAFILRKFDVIVVPTVEDGIRQLENMKHVDVIWLDHYLLGAASGLDFVIQIKSNPEWQSIPVFVVSNSSSTENIRSYIQLGAVNYYTKSDYDITQIIDDIEYSLNENAKK